MIAAHRGRSVAAATRALALAALLVVLATALGLSALAATQRGLDASSAIQAATGVGGAIVALRAALWSLVAALVSAADGTSRFAQRAEAALRERAPLLARRLLIGAAGASLVLAPLPASAAVWSPDGAATAVADARAAVNSQESAVAGAAQEAAAAPASATHASAHPLAWPTPAARPEPTSARTPPQKRVQREARVPARAATQSPTFPHASTEATSRTTGTRATVGPGDTLWGLTAAALPHASDADLVAAWPELHALNRDVIGADPHLLTPGSRLEIPAARHDGRAFDTSTTTRPESR